MNTLYKLTCNAKWQREVSNFVHREVHYCVSSLIHEMAQNEKYSEELLPICIQDDWASAAADAGWTGPHEHETGGTYFKDESDGQTWAGDDWQKLCQEFDIEPHQTEAYEHWIVSDWLATKLENEGYMILRDFFGLTIWGRTTTGQAISMDGIINRIYFDIVKENIETKELILTLETSE